MIIGPGELGPLMKLYDGPGKMSAGTVPPLCSTQPRPSTVGSSTAADESIARIDLSPTEEGGFLGCDWEPHGSTKLAICCGMLQVVATQCWCAAPLALYLRVRLTPSTATCLATCTRRLRAAVPHPARSRLLRYHQPAQLGLQAPCIAAAKAMTKATEAPTAMPVL